MADKTKLESAVNDTISWLDASQEVSEEDEEMQKELEAIANKLIADADVNKQVLPSIPKELVEYVYCALTAVARSNNSARCCC